jgi:hypothetical protein
MRIAWILFAVACAKAPPRDREGHDHAAGDRVGVHGMVLFGRSHHYLEHIPMFRPPHDRQLVLRVTLRDAAGAVIAGDFGGATHTVKPSATFSLDDLAAAKLPRFTGDVYRGNFEDGGTQLQAGVTFGVDQVLIARPLPGDEPIADGAQDYLVIGEPGDAYLSNVIRSARGFQQILRLDAIDGLAPSPSRVQRVTVSSATRLAPASTDVVTSPGPARVSLRVGPELWCLIAPEFVERCR